MMNKTTILLALIYSLTMTGCFIKSDTVILEETYSDLIAMSRDEVIARFGAPKRIDTLTGGGEEMIYESRDGYFAFVLSLRDGMVGRVVYAGDFEEKISADIDLILEAYSGTENWERREIDVYQFENLAWVRSDQKRTVAIKGRNLYIWGEDRGI